MKTSYLILPLIILIRQKDAMDLNDLVSNPNLIRQDSIMRIFSSLQWNQAQISSFQKATSDAYNVAFCYNPQTVSIWSYD